MVMASFRPFCAEARLATPVALSPGGYPCAALDSLLTWAALAKEGKPDPGALWEQQLGGPPPDIPLARVRVGGREVWAGSIGFPVGAAAWDRFGWTRKSEFEGEMAQKGPFRSRMEAFWYVVAERVRFYGFGDIREVRGLLEAVSALGHKRGRGFGRVVEWSVLPVDRDFSVWLEVDGAVYPARLLPLAAWDERPEAVGVVKKGHLDPPHWLRERAEDLLFPPPFLWEEGLDACAPPDRPGVRAPLSPLDPWEGFWRLAEGEGWGEMEPGVGP